MVLIDITQRARTKHKGVCLIYECTRKRHCKGMCTRHYELTWHRHRYGNQSNSPRGLWNRTIGAVAAHGRVRSLWGSASQYPCIDCQKPAKEWAYDGTDPTAIYKKSYITKNGRDVWRVYSRFPEFYMPLCLSCHRGRDNRDAADILHEYRLKKYGMVPNHPDTEEV